MKCSSCNGYGYWLCSSCMCSACAGVGTLDCKVCMQGQVPCPTCSGTSRIARQQSVLVFFSRTVLDWCQNCSDGKLRCPACNGSSQVTCGTCRGDKFVGDCGYCSSTRQLSCQDCTGRGRKPSEWVLGLPSLSPEGLMFEHQKHSSIRTTLEIKLSRLASNHDRIQTAYNTGSERARIERFSFNHEMYIEDLNSSYAAIDACRAEIEEVDEALV